MEYLSNAINLIERDVDVIVRIVSAPPALYSHQATLREVSHVPELTTTCKEKYLEQLKYNGLRCYLDYSVGIITQVSW